MTLMYSETSSAESKKTDDVIAGSSLFAGFLAFFGGASCCVLPIVLINLGVGSACVGKLAFFARAQPYVMAVTSILIVAGFVAAFWNGRRPSKSSFVLLIAATLLAIAAYILPFYAGQILRWVNQL